MNLWQAWVSVSLMDLIVFFPFVALMLILLWRSGRWELRVIRDELADESADTVTPEEFESIRREGLFQTRRIDSMERKRSSTLVNAQHELAFRKRRVLVCAAQNACLMRQTACL